MQIGRHKQLGKSGVVTKTGHGVRPQVLFQMMLQWVNAKHIHAHKLSSEEDM